MTELIDAKYFIRSIQLLSSPSGSVDVNNLIKVLLIYSYPLNISPPDLINLVELLINNGSSKEEDDYSIDIPDDSIFPTANDLLVDVNHQYNQLLNQVTASEDRLLLFVQSKTLQLSKYYSNINDIISGKLFDHVTGTTYYKSIILPFKYYYDHYGSIYNPNCFNDYLIAEDKFGFLINPLLTNNVANFASWMDNVIIPFIKYQSNNNEDYFSRLNQWLFYNPDLIAKNTDVTFKYTIWYKSIQSITKSFELSDFKIIVDTFINAVYFYALKESECSSIDVMKIYDSVKSTLLLLNDDDEIRIDYKTIDFDCTSLENFFNPSLNSVHNLKQVVTTCLKLFPINKLTIKKYILLKTNEFDLTKEVLLIINNMNSSNYQQLINLVHFFNQSFLKDDQTNQISSIIIEKLLFHNYFDILDQLKQDLVIDVNDFYKLLEDKFYESIDNATNLNENIGSLNNAKKCLQIFDQITTNPQLASSHHDQIVRFKHLFKSINWLKNFKIVINHKHQLLPSDLLHYFNQDNVLTLITTILEQNPKSYLAFEKLYRILNNLLLFYNYQSETDDYFNKLKTGCIESSLIDNNDFKFAYTQSLQLFESNLANLNELWLTFYQVAKYIPPDDEPTLDMLTKQRELLSMMLFRLELSENTKIVTHQWDVINNKIQNHHTNPPTPINESSATNTTRIANDFVSGKTNSEKLSNLFVSGLGWAIGANQHQQ
ncbi:hypothetical protein SBY92_002064 [Candida maltosa Xu316]